jgi:hypothetical protein
MNTRVALCHVNIVIRLTFCLSDGTAFVPVGARYLVDHDTVVVDGDQQVELLFEAAVEVDRQFIEKLIEVYFLYQYIIVMPEAPQLVGVGRVSKGDETPCNFAVVVHGCNCFVLDKRRLRLR